MSVILTVTALLGLIIFIIGGILHFLSKPPAVTLMVVGGLVYAIAQVILLFDALL